MKHGLVRGLRRLAGAGLLIGATALACGSLRPVVVAAESDSAKAGRRGDATGMSFWRIEIQGVATDRLTGWQTIGEEVEVEQVRFGTEQRGQAVGRGEAQTRPLVITKRADQNNAELVRWWNDVENGQIQVRDITINLLGADGKPLRSFQHKNCWPSAWDVTLQDNGQAIERITFQSEGIELK